MPFIVDVKDTDAKDDVRAALQDERTRLREAEVVIGMLHTELECWFIAAFEPESENETSRLAEICRGDGPGIGFDPRPQSEKLTATKREHEKLSPKRVLRHLTGEDRLPDLNGLSHAFYPRLKARGHGNGLTDFLNDLESRLIQAIFNVRVADV